MIIIHFTNFLFVWDITKMSPNLDLVIIHTKVSIRKPSVYNCTKYVNQVNVYSLLNIYNESLAPVFLLGKTIKK